MPSLYADPASLPPPPIAKGVIMTTLGRCVKTLHAEPPPFYIQLVEAIERLVTLSIDITSKQEGGALTEDLNAIAEVRSKYGTLHTMINRRLTRDQREIVVLRHSYAYLSLWLCLVDGWVANCEEFARKYQGGRFESHVQQFEAIYRELTAIVVEQTDDKSYRFDNMLHLFESLGLSNRHDLL